MADISFDDLIPAKQSGGGISFDDLIPAKKTSAFDKLETGIHTGLTKRGIGIFQTARDLGESLYGPNPHDPIEKAAYAQAAQNANAEAKGSGVPGFIGEMVSDPVNWMPIQGTGVKALAKAGAMIGGASGLTAAQTNDTGLAGRVKSGAIDSAIGAAAPTALVGAASGLKKAGSTLIQGATARNADELGAMVDAIKGRGDNPLPGSGAAMLNEVRNSGATLNPNAVAGLNSSVQNAIANKRIIPDLTPKTLAIVNDIKDATTNGTLTVGDLQQYRTMLGRVGSQEDSVLAGDVRKAIDSHLNTLQDTDFTHPQGGQDAVDLLNAGRARYGQGARFENVSDIITKADGDPVKLKSGLTRFLADESNTRGMTDEQIASLTHAAKTGLGEKLLWTLGKSGFDFSNGLTKTPLVGPLISGAVNPIIPVVGTAARQAEKYYARGKAENALRALESNAAPAASGQLPAITGALPRLTNEGVSAIAAPRQTPLLPPPEAQPQSQPQPQTAISQPTDSLFARVMQQESGGKQSAVSPKGAIGVSQIMPKTGPDAAKAAGLPFDPIKLRTDPNYNAALGKAYLGKMLSKYQGNETLALIAYNWGPGNTDMWIKSGAKQERLPAETQNYVKSILANPS